MGQLYPLPYGVMPSDWLTSYEDTVLQTVSYCEIWMGMNPYKEAPNAPLLANIKAVDGKVAIDRSNQIRRTASNVTLLLDSAGLLLPVANTNDGLYAPYGYEMRIYKGFKIPGATGVFATLAGSAVTVPLTVVSGTNDTFVYTPVSTGVPMDFLVTAGTYSTIADVATAMAAAVSVFGLIPFSNYCNVNVAGSALELTSLIETALQNGDEFTTGSPEDVLADLGFTSGSTLTGGVSDMEVAQLGVYLIEEDAVTNDANGVTLVGAMSDRSQWITSRGFQAPYSTDGTSTVDVAISSLLIFVIDPTYAFPFPETFTPSTYVPCVSTFIIGDDPWKACCDLAASAGMQLYFDYSGTLILEPIPDPNSIDPCVAYLEGTTTAPISILRTLNNKAVPNCVCVISQGSGVTTTQQVWWWDSNPSSLTFYADAPAGGFVPTNPQFTLPAQSVDAVYPRTIQKFDSTLIGPTYQAEQAQAVAIAIGLTAIGSLEKDAFTIRDQPAHDVDDVITMGRVVAGIPTSTNYIVDAVDISLSPTIAEVITARLVYA